MAVSLVAAAAFHWFGVDYAAGAPVDVTGWSDRAIAQLIKKAPVVAAASGGSLPVGVYLESAQNVTIVDGGGTNVPFDHLYNNDTQRTVLTAIPAGLGLDFVFDGSNATFTCTEDGVWSYQLGCYPNLDETGSMYLGLRGVDSIDFYVPNLAAAFWKPGWVAVNGASSFEAPAGTTFEVFAALLSVATADPYICNSWTAAFQRVR